MNMMTPNEFRMRLNLEIEIASQKFLRTKNRSECHGAMHRISTAHSLRQKDGYFAVLAGDKWLSKKDYLQIVGLHSFIVREKFLTDDKIEQLIACCNKEYPVLNDLLNRVPDAIDELRTHGVASVAMMYKQRKYIDTKMEEVTNIK